MGILVIAIVVIVAVALLGHIDRARKDRNRGV